MSTSVIFNNQVIQEPGSYAEVKSAIKNPPLNFSFGNIIIIDNGVLGATWGGGSGIDGNLKSKKKAIESFDNIDDFRKFVMGGPYWRLAQPLFRPAGAGSRGVSRVYFIKAATTIPAVLNYTFTGGGPNGGVFAISVRNEGVVGNGVVDLNNNLTLGYAAKMVAANAGGFQLVFYRTGFKGLDADSDPFDGVADADAIAELLCKSDPFTNVSTLYEWMKRSAAFNKYFALTSSTTNGTGDVDATDLATYVAYNLASGGTESYTTNNLDLILDNIAELDYTFIYSDQGGISDGMSALNASMLSHILDEARYDKFLWLAGGEDEDEFDIGTNGSLDIAAFWDNDRVVVSHGAPLKKSRLSSTGLKTYDAFYKAAITLGRTCGLDPQTPTTFKLLDIDGDVHELTPAQRIQALRGGVLHTKFDSEIGGFVINQDVNTLQNNIFLINEDATSFAISVKRIAAQLNKEIVINAKRDLLGNQTQGPNYNTLNDKDVAEWLKSYLQRKIATETVDNLLLGIPPNGISVRRDNDNLFVSYSFFPNLPISKAFFTGTILDPNVG